MTSNSGPSKPDCNSVGDPHTWHRATQDGPTSCRVCGLTSDEYTLGLRVDETLPWGWPKDV